MRRNRKAGREAGGQSAIEVTIALVMVAIFFVAVVKIFVWLNGRIVDQQVRYETTRVSAGSTAHETVGIGPLNDSTTEHLSIAEVYSDTDYPQLNIIR